MQVDHDIFQRIQEIRSSHPNVTTQAALHQVRLWKEIEALQEEALAGTNFSRTPIKQLADALSSFWHWFQAEVADSIWDFTRPEFRPIYCDLIRTYARFSQRMPHATQEELLRCVSKESSQRSYQLSNSGRLEQMTICREDHENSHVHGRFSAEDLYRDFAIGEEFLGEGSYVGDDVFLKSPSVYVRAAHEKILQRIDVQREAALAYLRAMTDERASTEKRCSEALRHLRIEVRNSLELLTQTERDNPALIPTDASVCETMQQRRGVRVVSVDNALQSNRYIYRRNQYLIRAIMCNTKWLDITLAKENNT